MTERPPRRVLLKVRGSSQRGFAAAQDVRAFGVPLEIKPVFQSRDGGGAGFGAADDKASWVVAQAKDTVEGARHWNGLHDWQLTHEVATQFDPATLLAAEPDLLQDYVFDREQRTPGANPFAAGSQRTCDPGDRLGQAPHGATFGWHLDREYSGLAEARVQLGPNARQITIAHLDTGYDVDQVVKPTHLDVERARNFVDGEPNDAREPADNAAPLKSVGHGTGTLGLLAGGPMIGILPADGASAAALGGAPDARVVPVRVANFVAQFSTSSIADGLNYAADIGVDVISMSLGGFPSHAWADAINRCYSNGIVVVAAAGNNFNGAPFSDVVWPARFQRVIAACGVMANGKPYTNLGFGVMTGNFGPDSKMETALSAYTPNVPWPIFGCGNVLARNGAGTSAATPQIAAAAALWLARHAAGCDASGVTGWRRVEAVRRALFNSAARGGDGATDPKLGRGALRAVAALQQAPDAPGSYLETPADTAAFAFLRGIGGFGIERPDPRAAVYGLEATQAAVRSKAFRAEFPDPERTSRADFKTAADVLLETASLSRPLRAWLEQEVLRSGAPSLSTSKRKTGQTSEPPIRSRRATSTSSVPHTAKVSPRPKSRRLRIYSSDPLAAQSIATVRTATLAVDVPWEPMRGSTPLQPGPVGEYIEVIDVDPASGLSYAPVDLNEKSLLAEDGVAPDPGDPRFHQQMVYAVAMRTIDRFERALGRVALWANEPDAWEKPLYSQQHEAKIDGFVRRLRIYPHALRAANAYYSPAKVALLFGYFQGIHRLPDKQHMIGHTVFTCLSHDIIAHETTHALLDGLHRRLQEATNPDVHAFHEGFADIVAIFQHFALPGLLVEKLHLSNGALSDTDLGAMAREFGQARGHLSALRNAIGSDPEVTNYHTETEAHDRGGVLVAAVFDAFLQIYNQRIEHIMIAATGGTSIPPPGRLHPSLIELLAEAARKTAEHVLDICIRALDYLPPVDITFSDYLRALVTADADLVPDDERHYRVAFIEAFRKRYIFPEDVQSPTTRQLRWRGPDHVIVAARRFDDYGRIVPATLGQLLRSLPLNWDRDTDRLDAYVSSRKASARVHDWITDNVGVEAGRGLGLDMSNGKKFEVHSVRPSVRVMPDGRIRRDIIVVLTQHRPENLEGSSNTFQFRSGATIVVDADGADNPIRYIIMKSANPAPSTPLNKNRLHRSREFIARQHGGGRGLYFEMDDIDEPFALLHQ